MHTHMGLALILPSPFRIPLAQALTPVLEARPLQFSIDLATLAARREYLNLEKWLQDRLAVLGVEFFDACVAYLHKKAHQTLKHAQQPPPSSSSLLAPALDLTPASFIFLPSLPWASRGGCGGSISCMCPFSLHRCSVRDRHPSRRGAAFTDHPPARGDSLCLHARPAGSRHVCGPIAGALPVPAPSKDD